MADPIEQNPAHALIICGHQEEKKKDIACPLSKVFQKPLPKKEFAGAAKKTD